MNPSVFDFIDKILSLLPLLLSTGQDVLGAIANARTQLDAMRQQNRGPTDQEWTELNARIDGLMAQLKG